MKLIDKSALVAEIERLITPENGYSMDKLLDFIDTLEVKETDFIVIPYDVRIQYADRESAIKAHAEDYSWNIESELFQQLTPEQQKLWRKEIEQACISGGYCGLNLQKDSRYDDNLEVKEVDLDFEQELYKAFGQIKDFTLGVAIAKRFYDMGRKHNEPVSEDLEDAASSFARKDSEGISNPANFYYTIADKARIFKAGAEWQIAKLMKDATEVTVHIDAGGYPYIPQMELYDYDKDIPLAKEGDKYKVILIKE